MKQTPIPEKINKKAVTAIDNILALLDSAFILIRDNRERIEAIEKRLNDKCKSWHIFTMGASKCDRCGIENPSYTAMRSTGESEFCEHKYPHIGNFYWLCESCNKPIKSQEDNYSLKQKLVDLLLPPHPTMDDTYKLADRILAIVKGE